MTDRVKLIEAPASGKLGAAVAIVGSGAGALTIAGELSRRGTDVLIIEAGPMVGSEIGRHRRNFIPDLDTFNAELRTVLRPHANADQPWPGLPGAAGIHGVGGMMTYWANAVPRPHPSEWDGPFAYEELEAFLDEADELLWSVDGLYGEGSARQQWLRTTLAEHFGRDLVKPNRVAARRFADGRIELAGGDTLLAGAKANVSILPETVVRRIHRSGSRVEWLEAVTRSGDVVRIDAELFVIGAGIIGTPQLLEASGYSDLPALGGYLTDHLNLVTRVLLKTEGAPEDRDDDPPLGIYFPVSDERPFHASILDIPSSAHAGILAGCEDLRTTDVGVFLGTEPVAANRLIFDSENPDKLGMPAVRASIELTEGDHARVGQAIQWQYEIVRSIGEPWRGMTPMFRPLGSSLHLMGTYRMGDDPATSVTDRDSRVWGQDNLYLAGNGLLRSRNSCNPTLTTVAVALAAASAILGDSN